MSRNKTPQWLKLGTAFIVLYFIIAGIVACPLSDCAQRLRHTQDTKCGEDAALTMLIINFPSLLLLQGTMFLFSPMKSYVIHTILSAIMLFVLVSAGIAILEEKRRKTKKQRRRNHNH